MPAAGHRSPSGSWGADLLLGGGAGLLSGSLGVGGGLVVTPALVLLRGVAQKTAQATALVMVAMTALAGVVAYEVAADIAWQAVPLLIVGGLVGAYAGAVVAVRAESRWLQLAFGAVMVVVAIRLVVAAWVGSTGESSVPELTLTQGVAYIASGGAMGLLSALFGIGGGIVLVPILVLLMGYPQLVAAGTSLSVMVVIATFGAFRLSRSNLTDWRAGARIGTGGMVGSIIGASVALYLPATVLTLLFAALLLAVGLRLMVHSRRIPGMTPVE